MCWKFKWLLREKCRGLGWVLEQGKWMCQQRWSHSLLQEGELGPQNALTEMTPSFPQFSSAFVPGWMGTHEALPSS